MADTVCNNPSVVQLRPELVTLLSEFTDWWKNEGKIIISENEVKSTLYHYTSMTGLLGIIKTERMWFTSVFHLNDPSELRYVVNIALEMLREAATTSPSIESLKEFCDRTFQRLIEAGGETLGFFVSSFSSDGNDLAQWRLYADDGRGVALAFEPKLFKVITDPETLSKIPISEQYLVSQINYNHDKCCNQIREAIGRALDVLEKCTYFLSDSERSLFMDQLATNLAMAIFLYATTSKDPAYAHEKETRAFLISNLDTLSSCIDTRVRGSTLVPYIPVPMPVRSLDAAISKIIVGPAADELAVDAVRAFLRSQGLPVNLVTKSPKPYRSYAK